MRSISEHRTFWKAALAFTTNALHVGTPADDAVSHLRALLGDWTESWGEDWDPEGFLSRPYIYHSSQFPYSNPVWVRELALAVAVIHGRRVEELAGQLANLEIDYSAENWTSVVETLIQILSIGPDPELGVEKCLDIVEAAMDPDDAWAFVEAKAAADTAGR